MVAKFSLFLFILLNVLVFPVNANTHNSEINLEIKNSSIEYGKPLNMYLTIQKGLNVNINEFLKPLDTLVRYSTILLKDESRYQVYKIKAKTLGTGTLIIPSLTWGSHETSTHKIIVTHPLTSKGDPIVIERRNIKNTPWEREQTQVMVSIITSDKDIILNSKNITQAGTESYLLKQSTKKINKNGATKYKHTFGWAIYFLYKQNIKLTLPQINYVKDGVPRYRFNFAKVEFNIKKLPVYVNPTTPIGVISLNASYIDIPKPFMQPTTTAIVQYKLSASGIPAKWLPSISQLYNNLNSSDIQYSHLKTSMQTAVDSHSIHGLKTVAISFTPLQSGLTPIKDVGIQYFDPKQGKLKLLTFKHEKLLVINWFLQLVLFVILLFISYIIIVSIFRFVVANINKYKYYKKFFRSIHQATSIFDIKQSLAYISRAEDWPINLSTNEWLKNYRLKYCLTDTLVTAFNDINLELYSDKGKTGGDLLTKIKGDIQQEVKNRKKVRSKKYFNVSYLLQQF